MKKLLLLLAFLSSPLLAGNITITAGGGSGGGSTVYPSTSTASFPYGLSASTITFANNSSVVVSTLGITNPAILTVKSNLQNTVSDAMSSISPGMNVDGYTSNVLWGGTFGGGIFDITTPDTTPTFHLVFPTGAFYSGVSYMPAGGGYVYFDGNGTIVRCSTTTLACTSMSLVGSPTISNPGLATDGTYLYIMSGTNPAKVYKMSVSGNTATVVTSLTLSGGTGNGLAIHYDHSSGYLITANTSGYVAKVTTGLSLTSSINVGALSSTNVDPTTLMNGNYYLGKANGNIAVVNVVAMSSYTITDSHLTYGMNNDGTNVYNMSSAEFIDVYPAGGTPCQSYIQNVQTPVMWKTVGGNYFVNDWNNANSYEVDFPTAPVMTRLGIGTTSPNYNLDVRGTESVQDQLYVHGQLVSTDVNGNSVTTTNGTDALTAISSTLSAHLGDVTNSRAAFFADSANNVNTVSLVTPNAALVASDGFGDNNAYMAYNDGVYQWGLYVNSPGSDGQLTAGFSDNVGDLTTIGSYAGSPANVTIVNAQNSSPALAVSGSNTSLDGGAIITNGTGGVSVSSMTVTGGALQLYSRSSSQIRALTPPAVGQEYYCNNCAAGHSAVCISTGTAVGAFALIGSNNSVCN